MFGRMGRGRGRGGGGFDGEEEGISTGLKCLMGREVRLANRPVGKHVVHDSLCKALQQEESPLSLATSGRDTSPVPPILEKEERKKT